MVTVRASIVLCLAVSLFAGAAIAQQWQDEVIKYTKAPDTYKDWQALEAEGPWLAKAFADPAETLKQEHEKVLAFLGKTDYDLANLQALTQDTLRASFAAAIARRALYDPTFQIVLKIADTDTDNRYLAVAELALLYDTVKAYIADYPKVADPAREIALRRLKDPRDEIKYLATNVLGAVKNAPDSRVVTDTLIAQLKSPNQGLIDASASALAGIGDKSAVRPLMEAFQAIPEDNDPLVEVPVGSEAPTTPQVNGAKFAIAVAVQKLAMPDLGIGEITGMRKSTLAGKYADLMKWWEENKAGYQ
jgi:hypothetical protein